jgi:hypothetical protein
MDSNSNAVSAPAANAVVKTEAAVEPKPLFDTAVFLNSPGLEKAFGLKPIIRAKDGVSVGGTMSLAKRGVMAKAFGLEGKANKDKLDDAIREEQVKAFARVRAWLLTRPDNATGLVRIAQRLVGKDNTTQTTVVIRDLPAREAYLIEKLAQAHGLTVEELAEFLAKKKAQPTMNVESKVSTGAAPVMTAAKK